MTSQLSIVGLGPAGLDRLRRADLDLLTDSATTLILRTAEHPAASDLADMRPVVSCDDLYETAHDFDGAA